MKKNKRIQIILVIAIVMVLFSYKDSIFQEGNPIPIFVGIIKLNNASYVKIDDNPVTYITKTNDTEDLFYYIKEINKVKFREQMGSGYIFDGDGKTVILTGKQYGRYYKIWKYSQR